MNRNTLWLMVAFLLGGGVNWLVGARADAAPPLPTDRLLKWRQTCSQYKDVGALNEATLRLAGTDTELAALTATPQGTLVACFKQSVR